VAGSVVAAAVGATLIAVDRIHNAALVRWHTLDLIAMVVLFMAAGILSRLIAVRTRRLVFDAARLAIENERARRRFRVYVAPEVAREALDSSSDHISLDGVQRHVAVLFCDLRDFTRYSNSAEPKQLVAELNAYFDAMVPAIQAHGGLVDKFMGDSIMAVFSREEGVAEPAARAILAAFAMHEGLSRHNQKRAASGLPPLRHGIGIHSGWVVAGNVGTTDRLQYTVIGDVVNVAARLEKATKDRSTWLLVSAACRDDALREDEGELPALALIGPIALRGVEGPFEAYGPPAAAARA
jgi:adenylate cyclase